ncbi:choline dehydrogenase [Pseudomonas putida]
MQFDYIIIGAGTAGSIMAARLSEDSSTSVLLVEAGGSDRSLIVAMPAAVPFAYQKKTYGWGYESGPEPHIGDRMLDEKRGKIIGGSSSINAMIFNRGNPLDYEGWAASGLKSWGYDQVLPYFRKMERYSEGTDAWRGGDGPMKITRCKAQHGMFERFLRSGEQAGHHMTTDHNGYRQEGLHISQTLIGDGYRWTTARGYLYPAYARPNLKVWTGAMVHKVLVEQGMAVGVEVQHQGRVKTVGARKEVILCAGAFNTPKLLMLSGIGPADELRKHGIEVKHAVEAVGRNLENHVAASVQYSASAEHSLASEFDLLKRAQLGLNWLLMKKGLGATSFYETGAFLRTRDDIPYPNLQFEFLPFMRAVYRGRLKATAGLMIYFQGCRPANHGRVTLTSADPLAAPSIIVNHLAEQQDLQDLVDGVRLAREMVAQPAWDGVRGQEIKPGIEITSQKDLEAYIKADLGTCYHPCGTCRMGVEPEAVTDESGRVKAVKNLRVVDASIIPRILTGNISAAVMMIAEKITHEMLGNAPLPETAVDYYGRQHKREVEQIVS